MGYKKLLLPLILILSTIVFSFGSSEKYEYLAGGKVIKRLSDGAKYQSGVINIKFKTAQFSYGEKRFGIANIDRTLSSYSVTKVSQMFPLKKNYRSWKIGDDDLARIFSFSYDSSIDPAELSKILLENNRDVIEYVEPAYIYDPDYTPNDPSMGPQFHLSKINAFQAWDITKGDSTMIIGIVDTGSDLDHPDLAANIYHNPGENGLDAQGHDKRTNGIDDDGNGYIDDWQGWDIRMGDNDPNIVVGGDGSHGSHVSGCASQVTDNGVNGAGIGFKCKLLITKHWDDNSNTGLWSTDQGVVYAYQNGAKVINCSFGSATYSALSQNIMTNAWNAGTVICASAGNGDENGIGQNWTRYPASYDNVVSVAALTSGDVKTVFSNYHTTVDISAPGQGIVSTYFNNSYATLDGTSMASPITAGTAALIRCVHPTWTPTQVVDRLKLGVDSIYNLNQAYVGLLGTGRVNALKCVSDLPILTLSSPVASDSLFGNNDKIFEVNEKVTIAFNYKNTWLAGNNVSLRLTTTDPNIEISKDSLYVGNLAAYGSYSTTPSNTFEVKAKPGCPFDRTVTFKLSSSSSSYTDNSANTFTVKFRQGYVNHNSNNLTLSVTNDGAIGKKTQAYGNGLFIAGNTFNQIFEGGLMIGTGNTKVSDVCRRGTSPANVSDTDFVPTAAYVLNKVGNDQFGSGAFNDDGAGSSKIGVTVEQKSFSFAEANNANSVIFRYKLRNTSGASLSNLYFGIYAYLTPDGIFSPNTTALEQDLKLGYTSTSPTSPFLGVALLTGQPVSYKPLLGSDVLTGFTTQEKWDALSNGVNTTTLGPGNVCFVISAGAINLAAGDTTTIGFAVVKGNSLSDLRANTISARDKFFSSTNVNNISQIIPTKYELLQNYPNPFNPTTKIRFNLSKSDFVSLKIFDITGKQVASLVNQSLQPGEYETEFSGANLSSGVYYYRLESAVLGIQTKTMMLVK